MALCPLMNNRCAENCCAWYDYDKEQCSILVLAKSTYKLKKDDNTLEEIKNIKTRLKILDEMIKQEG